MTDNGTKWFRIFGTNSELDISLHNFRPLETGKPVDPFKQPSFSNPAPVGEKPKSADAPPADGAPSKDKL